MIVEEKKLTDFTGANFGMVDIHGTAIYEGDVVLWRSEHESVVCHVHWNPLSFSFSLRELNGTDPMYEISPIRRQGEYVRIGNKDEYPHIVEKWLKLKGAKYGFLKQGEPDICFPLAAINACVGAGIEKMSLNFQILDEMIVSGECREWGGCVNEQGALNAIQRHTEAEFVRAENMDDVLESGGILTLKSGNGFHACAVFYIDDWPYLVNSNIGEGEFVRPLLSTDEIPRSDDPDHHRDYMLLKD